MTNFVFQESEKDENGSKTIAQPTPWMHCNLGRSSLRKKVRCTWELWSRWLVFFFLGLNSPAHTLSQILYTSLSMKLTVYVLLFVILLFLQIIINSNLNEISNAVQIVNMYAKYYLGKSNKQSFDEWKHTLRLFISIFP